MKKKGFLLLTFLVFLTSCSIKSFSSSTSPPIELKDTPDKTYDLVLTTPATGALDITATKEGAYFSSLLGTCVIAYLDEASGEIVPLCNRPECTHSDSTCTAYVDSSIYNLFMNPQQNKLFLSYSDGVVYDTEYPVMHFYSMDINGTNRRELFRMSDGYIGRDFAFSQTEVYFITQTFDKESLQQKYNLVCLDYETGNNSVIDTFPPYTRLIGAYDNFLILNCNNNSLSSAKEDIIEYNIVTKEKKELFHYETNGMQMANEVAFVKDAYLYIITPTENEIAQITRKDLRTQEEIVISNKIIYFGAHCNDYQSAQFADDFLFLPCSLPPSDGVGWPKSSLYAVNLSDGAQREITLKGDANQSYIFLGAMENNYIVYTRSKESIIQLANPDGTKSKASIYMSEFASFSKDDFLNSVTNPFIFR